MTYPRTVPDLFLRAVERHDLREFMLYKAAGEYVSISAREFREEVELAARALIVHLQQRARPGQASRMGRQQAIRAALHRYAGPPSSLILEPISRNIHGDV